MKQYSVSLTEEEAEIAEFIAKRRNKANRAQGVHDNVDKEQSIEVDILGMKGELGLCKIFGLYPDLDVGHRPFHDVVLPSGMTVDVKTTKYKTGHLAVSPKKKDKPSDIYALVLINDDNTVSLAGWLPYEEVIDSKIHPKYGCHWISQSELNPPESLYEI